MSVKFALLLLLVLYVQTTISFFAINGDEGKALAEYVTQKYWNDCQHHLSEESRDLLFDDNGADNEEIRAFELCQMEHLGWIKSNIINADKIIEDTFRFIKSPSLAVIMTGKTIVRICKNEAESCDNAIDIAGKFDNCIRDRVQTDI